MHQECEDPFFESVSYDEGYADSYDTDNKSIAKFLEVGKEGFFLVCHVFCGSFTLIPSAIFSANSCFCSCAATWPDSTAVSACAVAGPSFASCVCSCCATSSTI